MYCGLPYQFGTSWLMFIRFSPVKFDAAPLRPHPPIDMWNMDEAWLFFCYLLSRNSFLSLFGLYSYFLNKALCGVCCCAFMYFGILPPCILPGRVSVLKIWTCRAWVYMRFFPLLYFAVLFFLLFLTSPWTIKLRSIWIDNVVCYCLEVLTVSATMGRRMLRWRHIIFTYYIHLHLNNILDERY